MRMKGLFAANNGHADNCAMVLGTRPVCTCGREAELTKNRNPFLARGEQTAKQSKGYHRARKQEKETAKRLGGHTVLASGSMHTKGDVQVRRAARVECKATQKKSFSVTQEMLDKIIIAGTNNDEIPYIEIEFLDEAGAVTRRVAVLQSVDFEDILHEHIQARRK